ncbi:MAG: (2Fe-2S) ferredoxin domain-containing protein [Cyanobacteria bacterium P01_F01_bin.86]
MDKNTGVTAALPEEMGDRQPQRQVRVCQNTSCRKAGALSILQALQTLQLAEIDILASGCLGRCGNGPMVVVLPEQVWYHALQKRDIEAIATQHLIGGNPVSSLLDPQMHPPEPERSASAKGGGDRFLIGVYSFLILALLTVLGSIAWTLARLLLTPIGR